MGIMKVTTLAMFAFFIVLVCSNKCAEGLKILAIFPLNGKSHFVMCERLAKGLAEKGHQVDVYGHFPLKNPIPNYTDYSLKGSLPDFVNNVTYDFFQSFRQINMKLMMEDFANDFCGLLDHNVFQELFKRLKREQPYDIVITEGFIMNCYLAWGRFLNIPMVTIMTGELVDWYNGPLGNPVNLAVVPGRWSNLLHPMDFWGRLKNVLLFYQISFAHDYYSGGQNKYIEKHFGRDYPHAKDLIRDIDVMLVNSHFSLEGVRPYVPGIVPVAGLHIVDDGSSNLPNEVQKWLDESKDGCIYISFGSMVRIETFPESVLHAFYTTFKKIAPVRVLLKIAKPQDLPPGLPSNVMTQSWFSQIQVLKHKNIKAFVTHGGLMSTQEAIYAGVPLIGIPLFGDQFLNIAVQVEKKIALMLSLDDITETLLTSAIKEILNNSIYKKNMQSLSRKFFDRPMKPIDTATYWVEYIARHGKGALKSPVVDMPWWQANLLDVYGFILLILVSILYALKLIITKILRCFRPFPTDTQRKKVKKNQ